MSAKIGRPTNDPKPHNTRIRMSDADLKKLDYCAKVLGLTKADIIRQGIDRMYEEARQMDK